MASADAIPQDVNVPGTVLAVSDDGDALVVRPTDTAMPDLNVLVTPASVVRTIDGDLVEPDQLEFGDSLRVSGIGESGHVIAAEIMVARRVAANDDDDEASRAPDQEDEDEPEVVAPAPAVRPAAVVREGSPPRVEPRGKGKGNGNGRGKGKGRN